MGAGAGNGPVDAWDSHGVGGDASDGAGEPAVVSTGPVSLACAPGGKVPPSRSIRDRKRVSLSFALRLFVTHVSTGGGSMPSTAKKGSSARPNFFCEAVVCHVIKRG